MDNRSDSDRSASSTSSSTGLNDSWVEVAKSPTDSRNSGQSTPRLEKLLVEAQKESGFTSPKSTGTISSKDTLDSPPLSSHSGASGEGTRQSIPPEQLTKLIRDWSSRPEIVPPSDYGLKYEHDQPIKKKKAPLSVRNTRVMKEGWFNSDNFSTLILTHAACIVFGASLVCWYYKRSAGTLTG